MKRLLVAMDNIRITSSSTYDNGEYLSPAFLNKVRELYEGTRPGCRELQGSAAGDAGISIFPNLSAEFAVGSTGRVGL